MTIRRGDSIIAGNAGGIPSQTGQSGKFLTTNGTMASWGDTVDYTNITNCITEIPQDIKLELNDGTLKLKAGSKAYAPNGFEADGTTPKFDVKIIESDIIVDSPYTDGPTFIYYVDNTVVPVPSSWLVSGTSNTIIDGLSCWYDTTNNIIKLTFGSEVGYSGMSLPLAIINVNSNGDWTSIDQVFNGFGYMGSTVFALPGVKGLIPNGRNADGSLKSIEFTVENVATRTFESFTNNYNLYLNKNKIFSVSRIDIYDDKSNTSMYGVNIGKIVLDNDAITSFTPKTAFHAVDWNECIHDVDSKQDKSTAVNYNNISNCITEIPQDIKLELNNGTLTLKAGSKVYIPNGAGKFDEVIVSSDINLAKNSSGLYFVFMKSNGVLSDTMPFNYCYSSNSQPTITHTYAIWYDTANNKIKWTGDNGSTWTEGYSLPMCIVVNDTPGTQNVSSIDQVFNGFGYIDSTVYALPGVKGLIPNGRNADGSLKSIEFTTSTVSTYNMTANKVNIPMYILSKGTIDYFTYGTYFEDINKNIKTNNNERILGFEIGKFSTDSNGKITSFTPKTVFHAVDYNEYIHEVNSKQDIATAVNYNNISNCITEIPQDIKLELNNGTLTLKAGSKVYVPNGVGKFDEITIVSDLTIGTFGSASTSLLYYVPSKNSLTYEQVSTSSSGASHTPTVYSVWYDMANNVINRYEENASTPLNTVSLPIAIIKTSSSAITSIDQVFNGFGYIGSTVFALPGVKGLIPNGRNADGSLKSIEFLLKSVKINNVTNDDNKVFFIEKNGNMNHLDGYFCQETKPTTNYSVWYRESENNTLNTTDGSAAFTYSVCVFAFIQASGLKITSFTPKTVFHALDYNDAVQTPDATETVKGIVRLATSDEVTAGTNDSAAITPLKFKQKIAQNLTNPSADTVPSTKAVSDESSHIVSIMNTKVNKSGDTMTGRLDFQNNYDLIWNITPAAGNTQISMVLGNTIDAAGSTLTNLATRKVVNGKEIYSVLQTFITADGQIGTSCPGCKFDNSILTNVTQGSNYVRFGNGLQICWGYYTGGNYNFPVPFKDANYMLSVTYQINAEGQSYSYAAKIRTKTNTYFECWIDANSNSNYIAIGYWY